ncbi:MAG TPA: ABC transporter permease [Flavitalea sp.]|nr:ABC transporter permease [Flavitalea sp.]
MFENFVKQMWRNLWKHKSYSILNISGLAAGLTCFVFIVLWVSDELSYDRFNMNYDRIVRLTSVAKTETGVAESAVTSAPMAKALKDDYPEVENTVRFRMREEIVTYNHQQVLQPGILVTDPSFFDVFSYSATRGDIETALSEPYSLMLTESTAKKYFGDKDPMGQTLLLNMYDSTGRGAIYKITGILPDPPLNAHFTFNMLVSFKTIEVADPDVLTVDGWGDGSFYTYLLLKKGIDYRAFSRKISHFYGKYIGDLFKIWRPIYSYQLQPLSDIHLRSHLQYEIATTGDIKQVYIFLTIGIFILLLAGINYTNLATARSAGRAKEVSVKKVVGAEKNQLILQFLSESVLTAMIALSLSFLFTLLLQPLFFQITGKNISVFSSPWLVVFLFAGTIFLGILSGIYPALILSAFKPAGILKGSFTSGVKGIRLRKTLVVSQFVITILLVTGLLIIYEQMSFIKNKNLGFDKDALLFLRVHGNTDVINGYNAFKTDIQSNPLVSGITTSNSLIAGGLAEGGAETVDSKGNPIQVNTARLRTDADYFSVYGIRLLAGKSFTEGAARDTVRQVLLNETAVRKFGWETPEAAIGRPFRMGNQNGIIVGVTNNFHFNSLLQTIEPLAIYPVSDRFSRITLKVDVQSASRVVAFLENAWKKHFPDALFDYDFFSSQIKNQYEAEERFSTIFLYFSILSLLIACLGLYGLISFTIFQKTKEIGIRKILGATAKRIAAMLSADFLLLVLLAFFISIPIAWMFMNKWLQDFAYRIKLEWWMFVVAGTLVLLIALLTISIQSIKAAVANPVKSLRTE